MPDLRVAHTNGVGARSGDEVSEIERLRADVEVTRHRLGSSLAELERRVSVTGKWRKWRRWAQSHPLAFVAIGLGAGFLVGRWRSSPRRPV